MKLPVKRVVIIAVVTALGGMWYLALPPPSQVLPAPPADFPPTVRGAIHVHTDRSDGTGTVAEVAGAAASAGLGFVILTDHGDGTRIPDPPVYLRGVLMIDAVEISTNHGHVVAIGLPQSPYPLGGASRDVVEDIVRLGGMPIAAHPGSPKEELRWPDWDAPLAGLEWLNGDSEWRDEHPLDLARLLLGYPIRRAESLALVLDRPDDVLAKWDELTARRQLVALAASDAHARLGVEQLEGSYAGRAILRIPWYAQVFRAFSVAIPDLPLSRDPQRDADAVIAALRAGRVYSTIDALASPVALSFSATGSASASGQATVQGGVLPLAGPVHLRAAISAAPGTRIVLLRDGREVTATTGQTLDHDAPAEPGVYRVEVRWPDGAGSSVPWIVSNPIYIGRAAAPPAARPGVLAAGRESRSLYADGPISGWRVEHSSRAEGVVGLVATAAGGTELNVRYALGGARSDSPFVALASPASDTAGYGGLAFTARAAAPMRLSVQVRAPQGPGGERWARSIYLDETPREVSIAFADMRPQGETSQERPRLEAVDALLFVVDMQNTKLGSSGQFWIDNVRLVTTIGD